MCATCGPPEKCNPGCEILWPAEEILRIWDLDGKPIIFIKENAVSEKQSQQKGFYGSSLLQSNTAMLLFSLTGEHQCTGRLSKDLV